METKSLLTLQEVARDLGRSLGQVRRYVRGRELPAQKLGMQWFVDRQALEAFKGTRGRALKADALERARTLREGIRARVGLIDVAELIEESRRSHP